MRKKIDRIIFASARTGLIITMIGCLVSAIAAIVTVSFNISSTIRLNKNTSITLSEYDRGIPFYASLETEIPDSSVVRDIAGARSVHNFYPHGDIPGQVSLKGVDYSDKILSDFKVLDSRLEPTDVKLNGARLKTAVFYLQPRKFWDRLMLSLPGILTLLLIAFCSWQLFRLITAIHSGSSFNQASTKRIASIGWAIVITVLVLLIHDILQKNIVSIWMNFSSTIPNYRMPFRTTAYKVGFCQLNWLFVGMIILVVAKAFTYGNQLQKYEDSTI